MKKKTYTLSSFDALLITDIQKDFLPGGALPIEGGDEIIPVLNAYAKHFADAKAHIFASRDWHPANHISFKTQGGPWPPHCIQDTDGAKFSPDLKLPSVAAVISKATNPEHESYSVFDGTSFAHELKMCEVKRLFVGGLATDYCVVNTVLDARKLGYETIVLTDATLGINTEPGDVDRAFEAIFNAGAQQAVNDDFPDEVDALPTEETGPDALAEK
ncbi:MAG TPA: nicotinamidase, partial [Candidatus Acidoferrum sp.]|nr:nicotinamidase [Candidatus Acidoferrum sp.]